MQRPLHEPQVASRKRNQLQLSVRWKSRRPPIMPMRVRKAVFPAAGLGTRFLPATKAQPKEMLPLVDKPIIQYGVEEAMASGCDQISSSPAVASRPSKTISTSAMNSKKCSTIEERPIC